MSDATSARIESVSIYPIKSCGGVRLQEGEIVSGGLRGDRRFMLVTASGEFVTARSHPRLLQIDVALDGGTLRVAADGQPDLQLRAEPDESEWAEPVRSTVWRDTLVAREIPEGSAWFSQTLAEPLRLVYQPDSELRQVNLQRARAGDRVSLADGYPLLLTTMASLDDLNSRLEEPVPMSRFRPNVVISGVPAFAEDTWAELVLGEVPFRAPKLCDRCVMTTVNAKTGEASKEPLRTLAKYRRWQRAVWFGANLVPDALGSIRVGDEVRVNESRPHPRDT